MNATPVEAPSLPHPIFNPRAAYELLCALRAGTDDRSVVETARRCVAAWQAELPCPNEKATGFLSGWIRDMERALDDHAPPAIVQYYIGQLDKRRRYLARHMGAAHPVVAFADFARMARPWVEAGGRTDLRALEAILMTLNVCIHHCRRR